MTYRMSHLVGADPFVGSGSTLVAAKASAKPQVG